MPGKLRPGPRLAARSAVRLVPRESLPGHGLARQGKRIAPLVTWAFAQGRCFSRYTAAERLCLPERVATLELARRR